MLFINGLGFTDMFSWFYLWSMCILIYMLFSIKHNIIKELVAGARFELTTFGL